MSVVNFNYAIVAVERSEIKEGNNNIDILHWALYENQPTWNDYIGLYNELMTDEEFRIEKDFVLLPASDDMLKYMQEKSKTLEPEISKALQELLDATKPLTKEDLDELGAAVKEFCDEELKKEREKQDGRN